MRSHGEDFKVSDEHQDDRFYLQLSWQELVKTYMSFQGIK